MGTSILLIAKEFKMKHVICSLLLLCSSSMTYACDVCGCSLGNQSLGLLPKMGSNFIGLQYQQLNYSSVSRSLSEWQPDTYANEQYRSTVVWGRYYIGKNWQLFAFIPYRFNTYQSGSTVINNNGVGDISLLINYSILRTANNSSNKLKQWLQVGAGVKAPTGKYTGISERERSGLPTMQPGTGSWDIPVNLNYTVQYNKAGINADVSYNLTTANRDNYKYGNKLTARLTGFYRIMTGKLSIIPQVAISNQYALHDYDNYKRKWLNEETGGYILSARAGVQLYWGKVGAQVLYSNPITQSYGGGNITAGQRIDAGLMFLF